MDRVCKKLGTTKNKKINKTAVNDQKAIAAIFKGKLMMKEGLANLTFSCHTEGKTKLDKEIEELHWSKYF